MTNPLSFDELQAILRQRIEPLPDHRKPSPNTRYTIQDAVLSAFGIFFTQSPSFLEYQRRLQHTKGHNNAQTLLGVAQIPCDNQVRTLLDPLAPSYLDPVFIEVFKSLDQHRMLDTFRVLGDHLATLIVLLGQSMPVFWTGIMLMLLFAVAWNLLPASGWDTWASTVLPTITLGTFQAPLFLRISRSAMLEVLGLDYVRTARAKGLKERAVIIKHALKNAAIPIVTVIGLQFGVLLGGAVVTETVFAIPGTGRLIVRAIGQLDFPVVQAGVMTLALLIVLTNFIVDVLYLYLNPQVRIS